MVSARDIPAEVRWEIAARSATAMAAAYGVFLGKAFGDKANEIIRQIWIEGGKEAKELAERLGLPLRDAGEVDEAWGVLSEVLYGPEIKWDSVESGRERAVDRITGCPFLTRHKEMGIGTAGLFDSCQAYCRSVVESLNPGYTQKFESAMCQGAAYCRSVVEAKIRT